MWLKSLEIQSFRNYSHEKIDFHPGLNLFLGQNAQGKTNLLEAIYFLALTRSHRTKTDKDLIHFKEDTLLVKGEVKKKTTTLPLDIELTPKGRITRVNHLKQNRLSNYIGNLNLVLFAPEDLQLIKGAPALRRKFIDIELGQIKPLYLSDLSTYHHILKQRNSYLKSSENIDLAFLDVLDDQLIDYGSSVIKERIHFLEKLEKIAQEKHLDLSTGLEKLTISYLSSFNIDNLVNIKEAFRTALLASRKRDLFKKNTGVGPHRDDVSFFINEVNASFGSQGQQRSLVLSLKLAEIDLMDHTTKEKPLLLLDDVMSELDNTRQLRLLETISSNIQTFITTTSLEHLKNLPSDLKTFHIVHGTIQEEKQVI